MISKSIQRRYKKYKAEKQCIEATMNKTGWDRKTAKKNVLEAKKRLHISYKTYDKYNFCLLNEEEQKDKRTEIVCGRKNRKRNISLIMEREGCDKKAAVKKVNDERKKCLNAVIKDTSWTLERARVEMEEAVNRLGITYREFRIYRLARIAPEEQMGEYERRIIQNKKSKEKKEQKIEKVIERTGLSREEVIAAFEKDREKYGCTIKEWMFYKFDELSEEEKSRIFLLKDHLKIRRRYPYNKGLKKVLESKELTNNYFKEFIRRPWCINTDLTFESFTNTFENSSGIVYKPVLGLMGRGVEAFFFNEKTKKEVFDTITAYPRGVIEEVVIQHPVLAQLNPYSVNTMRIVSVSSFQKCVTKDGKHIDIAFITLKMGGSKSIMDNLLASGGVCASVDKETGVILTDGVDLDGNAHTEHPLTHQPIKGLKIPYVKEAAELVKKAIDTLKLEGVIGWDVTVTEAGPVLIEPNAGPDPIFANAPFGPSRIGVKSEMEKYLWED